MNYSNRDRFPAELEEIEARLRAERVTAGPLELDRIKLRAIQQADRPQLGFISRKKGTLMKSRLALMLMIATGVVMSTTGATLAISGSSGSGSAAENQYCTAGDDSEACDRDDDPAVVLGSSDEGDAAVAGVPPPEEQVATASTDSGTLPFTGFAAIPLLILGLGFVSVGLLLRFKANRIT